MLRTTRIVLVFVFFAAPVGAQVVSSQDLVTEKSAVALPDKPADDLPDEPTAATPIKPTAILPNNPAPHHNFLIRPFYDVHIAVLAEINAGAATWDDVATRMELDRGGYERNPLIRPFVHNSGTLAAETVGEVWLAAFVADRMKRSPHAYLRKTWWLPQVLDTSARLYGGINSTVLLRR